MKKIILGIGVVALLYFGGVFLRAHQVESRAEKYMGVALLDVARPWSVEKLERRATWGFMEKAKLKPSDIVTLANNSLGPLIEIIDQPKCNLQRGPDIYSTVTHTYAICVVKGKFEKATTVLTIRLQEDGDWKNGSWKIHHFISAVNS